MIEVKFFASLRDLVGKDKTSISYQPDLNLAQIWQLTSNEIPIPNNSLCSINLEYATLDSIVNDYDEVAFFPPVTGG